MDSVEAWRTLLRPGIMASMPEGKGIPCDLIVRDGALVLVGDGWEEEFLPAGFDTVPKKVIIAWGAVAMRAAAHRICEDHPVER